MRLHSLIALTLFAAIAACSSSNDSPSGSGGTSGQVELEDGTVGSACTDACADGLQCVLTQTLSAG